MGDFCILYSLNILLTASNVTHVNIKRFSHSRCVKMDNVMILLG